MLTSESQLSHNEPDKAKQADKIYNQIYGQADDNLQPQYQPNTIHKDDM